jgi:2-amino-4-hydroxy-6-hydroxymethyldihydropteridine diphosphokinase
VSDTVAFLALGSNLGDRHGHLARARHELAALPGSNITGETLPIETAPLGGADQPAYLNAMLRLTWRGTAPALLAACHDIEHRAGRERRTRWASRTLDIDLVRFGSMLCDRPDLTVPHPGLRDRTFWAEQLARLEAADG